VDSEPIRLTIYLSLAMLVCVCMSSIWLARDKPMSWRRIPYVRLALAFLALILLFLLMLAVSIRDMHWLSRSTLIWPIVAVSGGASVLGWAWWILAVRVTFRIERRTPGDNGALAR
jgi:hypothetical protein